MPADWTDVTTPVPLDELTAVRNFANAIGAWQDEHQPDSDRLEELSAEYLDRLSRGNARHPSRQRAMILVLSDLARVGRSMRVRAGRLQIAGRQNAHPEQRRTELLAQRDEQLRSSAVRNFVRRMERGHFVRSGRRSVLDLLRDGRELADQLDAVRRGQEALSDVVRPYVQLVEADKYCEHTGLLLRDIWRYFRHTWTLPYNSVPGRSMALLVRDAAARCHPVMGIAMLSSAAPSVRSRDQFLGWDLDAISSEFRAAPRPDLVRWMAASIRGRIDEIYQVDLFEDGLLGPLKLKQPDAGTIDALRLEAERCRHLHKQSDREDDHRRTASDTDTVDWVSEARSPLYRAKRCDELRQLLQVQLALLEADVLGGAPAALGAFASSSTGVQALKTAVRLARSRALGTEIADLSVCGAIPPYGAILGGKLVAMLCTSPVVVRAYKQRYEGQISVIASSMAGRPIRRSANLAFIGTTSLYGERPCQYDRLTMPADLLGGPPGERIRYKFLERSVGWGSFQFGDLATEAIHHFLEAETGQRTVRYKFGEGASPKFRALRDALPRLGFDESYLQHGHERAVYGVALLSNVREYLLGMEAAPNYLMDLRLTQAGTQAVIDWWYERWVQRRVQRQCILDLIREHDLVHPIRHGGRVALPKRSSAQESLF